MSDTTPVLSPCPFCGSVTRIHSYSKRIGKATPTLFQTAQVKCKKQSCGMSGPLVKGDDCRRRAAARFNAAIQPRLDQQRIITSLSEDASKAAELAEEVERLRSEVAECLDGEPEYHHQGMGCGLEDRGITDRYAAMQYGWEQAMERVYGEHINPARAALDAKP